MGGIGKTQVAIEYAFRCHEREEGYPYYGAILWTRAETTTDLLTGYGHIASYLGCPATNPNDQRQVAAEVRIWFETHFNWLLIFDNADDPDLIEPFRPRNSKGHILLTSRAHTFKGNLGIHRPIELRSLLPHEAILFLLQRTKRNPDKESSAECNAVADLANELGNFPLALEQAAAHILVEDKRFATYLVDYRKREQELLNQAEPETGDYRDDNSKEFKTVLTTWDLNFRAIETASPASAELLHVSAFLAPDNIPIELVIGGASHISPLLAANFSGLQDEHENENAYDALLAPLLRYSFIEKNRDTLTYSLHRLVQSVQRYRLGEQQRVWAARAVAAMNSVFPNATVSTWNLCERLVTHTQICSLHISIYGLEDENAGRLLFQSAYYLMERGQYKQAQLLFEQALRMGVKVLGPEHPRVATTLNSLARVYRAQALYGEAESLFKRALAIRIKEYGSEHPRVAAIVNNLGELFQRQDRYDDAEPLLLKASAIWEDAMGPEHPDTSIAYSNLAIGYIVQQRFDEATLLLMRVLNIREKGLGLEHPHVAYTLDSLPCCSFSCAG